MSRIVVLGGGESGVGSAVLATVKGFTVFLSDKGIISDKYRDMLDRRGIDYEHGGHTPEKILSADLVIKSPGIPDNAPMVKALREIGTPIISEIEFAGRYSSAKTICITGSNGKTTTTTLIYKMLQMAGYNVALAGNIGESFALSVATASYDWYVLELSSFQLDGMEQFRADVSVLMNITPDHLDRYDYFLQNYVDSKFRVIQNQGTEDTFIYCAEDPLTVNDLSKHELVMQCRPFSVKRVDTPAYLDGEALEFVYPSGRRFSVMSHDLKIKGIHNTYNAMAATLAAMAVGVHSDDIVRALKAFTGVEHRLEPCGEIDGVYFVNDSKATNVDSVWYALESMKRPVVWIAGGQDKGNDYSSLYDLVSTKVKCLVCMGVDNSKLMSAFEGRVAMANTHSFGEAMDEVMDVVQQGDVVLLSPACASFDLFDNYEERGHVFKNWVECKRHSVNNR